ncbi:MAG: hypothetical protein C207_01538 [Bradyrhizobium sp. DFCI-1]|jgi:hypothetical protein|nr:MAG: hypothetical protein C207_01538 [Bradyrhizobium sp. DFCI-1]
MRFARAVAVWFAPCILAALDTAYGPGWEKTCPSLDDEVRPRTRPAKSTNDTDQIPFPSIGPPPLAGPKPIGPAGGKPIPKG